MRPLILSLVCLFYNMVLNAQPKTLNIVNFGAKPGLEALNTKAIQNAIDVAGKSGGG
jgi:hypothetical protein